MSWIETWKPASSRRGRLLAAAALWSAVGAGLLAAGSVWLLSSRVPWVWFALAAAVAAGWAKGRWVLERVASRNARRILSGGEERCLGGAFSWGAWLLAAFFMALGFLLRRSPLPREWLGAIYVAVGAALLLASRVAWRHWRELREGPPRV